MCFFFFFFFFFFLIGLAINAFKYVGLNLTDSILSFLSVIFSERQVSLYSGSRRTREFKTQSKVFVLTTFLSRNYREKRYEPAPMRLQLELSDYLSVRT